MRNRCRYLLAVIVTIALGLASRRFPGVFPGWLGKYPGDALWALMTFFAWGLLFPRIPTLRRARLALVTSFMVEFIKLYEAPWIVTIRYTTLGHLVFGQVFSWQNLIAYTIGVVAGVAIEQLVHRCRAE